MCESLPLDQPHPRRLGNERICEPCQLEDCDHCDTERCEHVCPDLYPPTSRPV